MGWRRASVLPVGEEEKWPSVSDRQNDVLQSFGNIQFIERAICVRLQTDGHRDHKQKAAIC
jgi:hypothetical protein